MAKVVRYVAVNTVLLQPHLQHAVKPDQLVHYYPEILHSTVWRTWLFIAHSDERWGVKAFTLIAPISTWSNETWISSALLKFCTCSVHESVWNWSRVHGSLWSNESDCHAPYRRLIGVYSNLLQLTIFLSAMPSVKYALFDNFQFVFQQLPMICNWNPTAIVTGHGCGQLLQTSLIMKPVPKL